MRIGFIGLGKLGLPVSIAISAKGHIVWGYDINEKIREEYKKGICHLYEPNIEHQLKGALVSERLRICDDLQNLVNAEPEIIFIAVPTPSKEDQSFDTSYVVNVLEKLGKKLKDVNYETTVAIISTVLPRTTREIFLPIFEKALGKEIGNGIDLCYNASFIAMGTTIVDFYNHEFYIIGENKPHSRGGDVLEHFYKTINERVPLFRSSYENIELTKMCYNTYIGFKIIYANNLMETCYKIPYTNCDDIMNILFHATRRIISPAYLKGGLGDGGECHPRDNRALSWLANDINLSTDMFGYIMDSRKKQAEWIADLLLIHNMPIVILGIRYKENTNLTSESGSLLVKECIEERGGEVEICDPALGLEVDERTIPVIYLVGHKFEFIKNMKFNDDDVIIDPWNWLGEGNYKYLPVGRNLNWN